MEGAEEGGPHPCPGSFSLCDTSPLIARVISNLPVEPMYVRTHLHACAYTQHTLNSNLVFVKGMFHFSRPQFHSLQGAGFPELLERSRARTGLAWTSEAGKEWWGDGRAGGSPVIPIPVPHQGPPRHHRQNSCAPCAQGWSVREVETGGNKKKLSSSKDSPSHGGGEQHKGGGR